MKVTIITSTLNCKDEISKTAKSIRSVFSSNIQWIIIDGASTDGTLEYLNSQEDIIDTLVSEKDSGIYDAWNKASRFISGDWVIFLGAGDTLIENNINNMLLILGGIDTEYCKLVYGNVRLIDSCNNFIKKYGSIDLDDWSNGRPSLPSHQGTFQHSSLFDFDPVFDTKYKIAADSKFLLLSMKNTSIKYIDIDVSNMQYLGVSTNPQYILKVKRELDILKGDIGYNIPLLSRSKFILKAYVKHIMFNYLKFNIKPRN